MQRILEALAITAEICGADAISPAAAKIMLADLSSYSEDAVLMALQRVRREHKGKLSLAAILERLDDGRLGADEAWSLVPKDDRETAVVTQEMLAAWSVAQRLYDDGDETGARMAFRDAYNRTTTQARAAGKEVNWFISAGWDAKGKLVPIADALRLGRIDESQALQHLHGKEADELRKLVAPALSGPSATKALPNMTGESLRKPAGKA